MNQYNRSHKEQTPSIKTFNHNHWSKHHKMTPIINATINTATILHNMTLKWTIKQNTNIITQEIKNR